MPDLVEYGRGVECPRLLQPPRAAAYRRPSRRLMVYARDTALTRHEGALGEVLLPPERLGDLEDHCFAGSLLQVRSQQPGLGARIARGRVVADGTAEFAVQMAYAVSMSLLQRFRDALGRMPDLTPWPGPASALQEFSKLTLEVGLEEAANAWYDADRVRIVLPHYAARYDSAQRVRAGNRMQTAHSHDIIAHEMAHAVLDGLRPHFCVPSNIDVPAFHEGFADLVALFARFAHEGALRTAIARAGGDVTDKLLIELAAQFGRTAVNRDGGLRTSLLDLAEVDDGRLSRYRHEDYREPHARGAVLVSAVFAAYRRVFRRRTAHLACVGSNAPLAAPLVAAYAHEAARVAQHFFRIVTRAIDYLPPADVTFGDYLRAMLSADADVVPEDPLGYREELIHAFCRYRIDIPDVADLSESELLWRGPDRRAFELRSLRTMARKLPVIESFQHRKDGYGRLLQRRKDRAGYVREFLYDNRTRWNQLGLVPPGGEFAPAVIESVRGLRRRGYAPDSFEFVVEIAQARRLGPDIELWGGCTLIVDEHGSIRLVIRKRVDNQARADRLVQFWRGEGRAYARWAFRRGEMLRALDA